MQQISDIEPKCSHLRLIKEATMPVCLRPITLRASIKIIARLINVSCVFLPLIIRKKERPLRSSSGLELSVSDDRSTKMGRYSPGACKSACNNKAIWRNGFAFIESIPFRLAINNGHINRFRNLGYEYGLIADKIILSPALYFLFAVCNWLVTISYSNFFTIL